MKILVYPHDLDMGGSQINAIDLASAVSRLGHECVIFGRPGKLCERIEASGLEFIEAPVPGHRPSWRVVRALRETVVKRGIDIVHGYEWPPGLEAVLAARGRFGAAPLCTVMSMAVAPFLPRTLPLIVGTQQIAAAMQQSGRVNVNLIEPPVDTAEPSRIRNEEVDLFRRRWGLGGLPAVISVSRLVPDLKTEGLLTAIEVVADLADTHPFQLVIVGDGESRGVIERAAERVNRLVGRHAIVLTGELADPNPAYAAADIALGMGGSALRSLTFGRPLIVQGERGYFRTLTPASASEFRWQGWYGVGTDRRAGRVALAGCLRDLLSDATARRELGEFGGRLVADFSLERAARRQITIYKDVVAGRSKQRGSVRERCRSITIFATYTARRKLDRLRRREQSEDFNSNPLAASEPLTTPARETPIGGPILYFPGVAWDTLAGTDQQLARALAEHEEVIWVDPPRSILRGARARMPAVTHPAENIVRLHVATLAGAHRPILRNVANRRRAGAARAYLARRALQPRAVIASTPSAILPLTRALGGIRVYYATDDFVEAANLWGLDKGYLNRARERNLAAADLVVAVTPELGRHLQRGPTSPRWLPNGADLERFSGIADEVPAPVPLTTPIAGVVGQFNARTDLSLLEAVRSEGVSLLLVGPRWFISEAENEAFDRLIGSPGVHWVSEVPRDELVPYLRALDIGLTPYADSMFNRRSYPLKTLEYLAAGIPAVTMEAAMLQGVDRRYVREAFGAEEFGHQVLQVSRGEQTRSEVQSTVASEAWRARAEDLLMWIREEARADGSA